MAATLVACGVGATAATGPTGPISVFLPLLAVAALATGRMSAEHRLAPLWLGGTLAWCLARAALEAEPWSGMADAIITVMFGVLPWLIGRHLRQRAALLRAGWQRADSLERELAAVSEQERLRERARIAEEMHDSLGHELSLMAVRAGALEVGPGLSDDEFRRAVGDLREGATSAIDRLQEIVGVLDGGGAAPPDGDDTAAGAVTADIEEIGEPDGDPASAPTYAVDQPVRGRFTAAVRRAIAATAAGRARLNGADTNPRGGVATLVRRAEAAGMAVEWDVREPRAPESVVRSAQAVVREGLTNAAKHAPGARVTVAITADARWTLSWRRGAFAFRGGATRVSVANDPPGGAKAPRSVGGGRGLAWLDARVRRAGGSLDAGPRGDGGFRVAALLPHNPDNALPQRRAADTPSARRRPRELVSVLTVCVGLLLPLVVAWYAYAAYLDRNAALSADEYARIGVGQQGSEIRGLLPEASLPSTALVPDALRGVGAGDPPPACADYRSRIGPPWSPAFYYRVCFQDGRVVAKCSYNRARMTAAAALRCTGSAGTAPDERGGADTDAGDGGGTGRGNA